MYDEFCKMHAPLVQHAGQKEAWNRISSKWGYCRQDLVEKFVTQCKASNVTGLCSSKFRELYGQNDLCNDQPILPCTVLEKLSYNDTFKYRLGCKDGL
ncbi:23795_t:CDS:2 [Gigaspora margarita]|uniref:23795_t:CDS:1 n=1 Tax=Gigaspora margarita TaxID=4874 RepID=A0ABN7U9A3_GIGMA|nr:23795_t:CDS:2 [Gigaspora margarita]